MGTELPEGPVDLYETSKGSLKSGWIRGAPGWSSYVRTQEIERRGPLRDYDRKSTYVSGISFERWLPLPSVTFREVKRKYTCQDLP